MEYIYTIRKREINNLVHFTHIRNLSSILIDGLKPRDKIEDSDELVYTDKERKDGHKEYISFSIEYPNYMYLDMLRRKCGDVYIIILIEPYALCHVNKLYFKSNPIFMRWGKASYLEDLFFNEFRWKMLPKNMPTDPRAELMAETEIKISDIKKIIFPYNLKSKLSKYYAICEDLNVGNIFEISDYFYQKRIDWKWWANKKNSQ